jgi:short chain dehydrogenase
MPVIAIVGAGPGLGLSVARRSGREGFTVALISRSAANLERLAAELAASGIEAAGFAADVRDRRSLTAALSATAERSGPVDVLEYSPAPHGAPPEAHAGLDPAPGDDVQRLQGPGQHHRVPHGDGGDDAPEPDALGERAECHRERQRVEHAELGANPATPIRRSVA